jgi:predicted transcriptional regulator
MAKEKKFDFNSPSTATGDEDEKTLAAIDEGILDAENGRTIPIEEIHKRLHKWITASSSRKGR